MAGTHRCSEPGPVHPSFDFASIDAERIEHDPEVTAEHDALQIPGEQPDSEGRTFQARRSMASPISAERIDGDELSAVPAGPPKEDISARLDAARRRLKRAADVASD
ncbi:MAG: hypothetical protein HY827_04595 [Actinobacteria bacterium]|nr:hypothetical protein [Actinomycetota bacterium]